MSISQIFRGGLPASSKCEIGVPSRLTFPTPHSNPRTLTHDTDDIIVRNTPQVLLPTYRPEHFRVELR